MPHKINPKKIKNCFSFTINICSFSAKYNDIFNFKHLENKNLKL